MNISKEILEEMAGDIRADKVICIAVQMIDEAIADDARDAFDEDTDKVFAALELPIEEWEKVYEEMNHCPSLGYEEISYYLRQKGKQGFLVQFATPLPRELLKCGSYTFHWGYYARKWIYGDTMQEACEKALPWREEIVKKTLARLKEKQINERS
ncbi:hypothetical protein [Pseudoalteromonas sp. T1lg10]|uniref:hypothetical protein n=1 Tax=Pseudoalteromonas sp. T1lg10 TaxID=2077093 RepID=UPI000CF6A3D2|nr:hypothetical protein [Pseudoalteromonas sp. T1lg10]